MKYSAVFGNNTLRENPSSSGSESYSLLLRAGYIRTLGPGLIAMMPLGYRVVRNLKRIIAAELDDLGGQEMELPVVVPFRLWKKTNRADTIGRELVHFEDRHGRDLVLSSSHLEAAAELGRLATNSYRDFPRFLYQFRTKFRDEDRSRFGLFRAREFLMNDAYSFHRSYTDLNIFFPKIYKAYERIFRRCGIETVAAESAVGTLSGDRAYEFLMLCSWGDITALRCPGCGYTANKDVAIGIKPKKTEIPLPAQEVDTGSAAGREQVAAALGVGTDRLLVTELFRTIKGWVLAAFRGDYDISIEKLSRFLQEPVVGPATDEEVRAFGLVPNHLFPEPGGEGFRLVVDDSAAESSNLIAGGRRKGVHIVNVNFGIDYESDLVSDVVCIHAENRCLECDGVLEEIKGIELGNIFKLGDFFARSLGFVFTEEDGEICYPQMGSYGIGLGRLMHAVVDSSHDERGIIWPEELAPFRFYLMGIGKSLRVKQVVEIIAAELGDSVLFDDRHETAGVKFKDCDLLGIPYRIVISTKSLAGGEAEMRERSSGRTWRVPVADIAEYCKTLS